MPTPCKSTTTTVTVVPWLLSQPYQDFGTVITNTIEQVCQ